MLVQCLSNSRGFSYWHFIPSYRRVDSCCGAIAMCFPNWWKMIKNQTFFQSSHCVSQRACLAWDSESVPVLGDTCSCPSRPLEVSFIMSQHPLISEEKLKIILIPNPLWLGFAVKIIRFIYSNFQKLCNDGPMSVSSIHLCCVYKKGLYPVISWLLPMEISLNNLSGNFFSSLFLGVHFLEHLLFGCQLPGTIFHFVICPSHFSFLYQFVSLARFFFQIFIFLLRHYLLISIRILITGFL